MTNPFIGADDLGAFLHTTVDPDDLLTKMALNTACQAVRDYCDSELTKETDVILRLDGTGKSALVLPKPPVREVTEVTELGTLLVEEATPDDGGDYWQHTPTTMGILHRVGSPWPCTEGAVVVKYTRGYDVDTGTLLLPDTIRAVAVEIAADVYSAGNVGRGGLTSETMGDYSYTRDASVQGVVKLTEEQEMTLYPYRHSQVA